MSTKILHKRNSISGNTPVSADIELGELALNVADGILYTKKTDDSVVPLKFQVLNTTDDLSEGSSNLYYTDERVDDRVSNLLIAGNNVDLTYDDVNNTLTVDVTNDVTRQIVNVNTTPFTISNGYTINVNTNGTINLPGTPSEGRLVYIRHNSTTGDVRIEGNGNTINNDTFATLTERYTTITLHYNSTQNDWMII